MVRAAKESIKSRSSVPIFMARLGRLQREGRAPQVMLVLVCWNDWVAYLQKLKSDHKLRLNSYETLTQPLNRVACGLNLLINAPVNSPDVWTIIPILNKEKTDIKEIVIASPVNSNPSPSLIRVFLITERSKLLRPAREFRRNAWTARISKETTCAMDAGTLRTKAATTEGVKLA